MAPQSVLAIAPPQPLIDVEGVIVSLADALNDLSSHSLPGSGLVSDTSTQRHCGKAYYSIVVGRCCGVYNSW